MMSDSFHCRRDEIIDKIFELLLEPRFGIAPHDACFEGRNA